MVLRDYTCFTERLESLNSSHTQIETVGVVDGYPIHRVSLETGQGVHKNILIAGGIHGDEPAGPASVLRFLERDNTHLLQQFQVPDSCRVSTLTATCITQGKTSGA